MQIHVITECHATAIIAISVSMGYPLIEGVSLQTFSAKSVLKSYVVEFLTKLQIVHNYEIKLHILDIQVLVWVLCSLQTGELKKSVKQGI